MRKTSAGFTIVELVVTIAVASIVMTLGVPSFKDTIQRNRIATQANEFIGSLVLARSEAITRGADVIICKSSNLSACSTSSSVNYNDGWLVYSDTDSDGSVDSGEIIRTYDGANGTATIVGAGAGVNQITYLSSGFADLTAKVSFVICDPGYSQQRTVALRPIGRAKVTEGSSSC